MTKRELIDILNDLGSDDMEIKVTTFEGDTGIRCIWPIENVIFIETNDFDYGPREKKDITGRDAENKNAWMLDNY